MDLRIEEVSDFLYKNDVEGILRNLLSFLVDKKINFYLTVLGQPRTNGKDLYISLFEHEIFQPYENIFTLLKATLVHEAQHIISTNMKDYGFIIEKIGELYSSEGIYRDLGEQIGANIINILEDGRIERIASRDNPGLRDALMLKRALMYKNIKEDNIGNDDLQDVLNTTLTLATMGKNLPNQEKISKRSLEIIDNIKRPIIFSISSKTTIDMKDYAFTIAEEILPLVKEKQKEQEEFEELMDFLKEQLEQMGNDMENLSEDLTGSEDSQELSDEELEELSNHFGDDLLDLLEEMAEEMENKEGDNSQGGNDEADEENKEGEDNKSNSNNNGTNSESNKDDKKEESSSGDSKDLKEENSEEGENKDGNSNEDNDDGKESETNKNNSKQNEKDKIQDDKSKETSNSENNKENNESNSKNNSNNNSSNQDNKQKSNKLNKTKTIDKILDELEEKTKDDFKESKNSFDRKKELKEKRENKNIITSAEVKSIADKYSTEVSYVYDNKATSYIDKKILREANIFKRDMERIFKNHRTPNLNNQDFGVINPANLVSTAFNDYSIFTLEGRNSHSNYVGYILQDLSGSMAGYKLEVAFETLSLIEHGLKDLMPLKIVGFTDDFHTNRHICIKDFEDSDKRNYAKSFAERNGSMYGNDDGVNIAIAAKELMNRQEKDKILIILSDGTPAREEYVYTAVTEARKNNIKVIPIFFGSEQDINRLTPNYQAMYGDDFIATLEGDIRKRLTSLIKRTLRV